MNKALVAVTIILALVVVAFVILRSQGSSPTSPQVTTQPPTQQQPTSTEEFSTPKKSAHFESNTPEHGATLAGVPINIVIDFNFDLAKGSDIRIEMGNKDYGVGETIIDDKKLAMRRKMDSNSPDGVYTVFYKACWADGSCHEGSFQFKIDRTDEENFVDMTNQKEVTINLRNIAFNPAKVKVSKGTKVTWINQDDVIHTVNTDAHPAHTYYLKQNSRDLKKGDIYSVIYAGAGIYLYHCTPHAGIMRGQILVK